MLDAYVIRPFVSKDQASARQIIERGLSERWGFLDPTKNPDLNDIEETYLQGCFLVVFIDGELIATGGFLPEMADTISSARISRMSVLKAHQGQGVGKCLLAALEAEALSRGFSQCLLETTQDWSDAVAFYVSQGYTVIGKDEADVHFKKLL